MTLPNIIIPGAPKAGTTSIVAILKQHPDVYVAPLKEPRFFIGEEIKNLSNADPLKKFMLETSILNWDKYKQAYSSGAKFNIDASIQYSFYYKNTIPRIKAHLGDPYIILILRNPVDRAISNFMFLKSEKCNSLVEAIKDELAGNRANLHSFCHYYEQGLYYEQVKAFKANFTNVMVLFYEDFIKDNLSFVNSIFSSLDVPPLKRFKAVPHLNTSVGLSGTGKFLMKKYTPFRLIYKRVLPLVFNGTTLFNLKTNLRARFSRKKDTIKVPLTNEDRQFMTDLYKEDVKKLTQLPNIKKTPWKGF
jgi:hypothetical protein